MLSNKLVRIFRCKHSERYRFVGHSDYNVLYATRATLGMLFTAYQDSVHMKNSCEL